MRAHSQEKHLQECYENLAKLSFSNLLLLQAQLSDHIHKVFQHYELQKELRNEAAGNTNRDGANTPDSDTASGESTAEKRLN